jgi:activator of HSP90 ATPase
VRTKTLKQTITFKASPRQVYDMIMVSRKHQSLSGERAKISQRVGGKFTAWSSHLSGINLVLKPGKKIVQAWRATGWCPDHYSIVIFDISKVKSGSKLKFTQIGIPPHRYSGHYRGWIETYWTPMKEIFAKSARGRGPESTPIGQSGSSVRGFDERCRRRLSSKRRTYHGCLLHRGILVPSMTAVG